MMCRIGIGLNALDGEERYAGGGLQYIYIFNLYLLLVPYMSWWPQSAEQLGINVECRLSVSPNSNKAL